MDNPTTSPELAISHFENPLPLAKATGTFYNSLLDTYLTPGQKELQDEKIKQSLNLLPSHARPLYEKGIQTFEAELLINHELLQQHRGSEAEYVISNVMQEDGKSKEDINETIANLDKSKIQYAEPYPGVGIIQLDHDMYYYLQKMGVIPYGSSAVNFSGQERKDVSAFVIQRLGKRQGFRNGKDKPSEDPAVRHEFHHFVWNFLERTGFTRDSNEKTDALKTAFKHFRNEMVGYTVQERPFIEADPEGLVYTDNKTIRDQAIPLRNLAYVCMSIAKAKGIDSQMFIYPAMTSRNFQELEQNILTLTPVNKQIDIKTLSTMRRVWSQRSNLIEQINQLIAKKGVKIDQLVLNQFLDQEMQEPTSHSFGNSHSLHDFRLEADNLARFNDLLTTGLSVNQDKMVFQAIKKRIPLPEDVINQLVMNKTGITENIPITSDPEFLLRKFISIWDIDRPEYQELYSLLLKSSQELRSAYDRIKDDLIEKEVNIFKKEFNYEGKTEEQKKEHDRIIQRKRQLLSDL